MRVLIGLLVRVQGLVQRFSGGVRAGTHGQQRQPNNEQVTEDLFHRLDCIRLMRLQSLSRWNLRVNPLAALDLAKRLPDHRPATADGQQSHAAGHQQIRPGAGAG